MRYPPDLVMAALRMVFGRGPSRRSGPSLPRRAAAGRLDGVRELACETD